MMVVPGEENHCRNIARKQQQNLLCLETNVCFSQERGSQTDPAVVAGVSTGNNRF